ncbi:MAG: ABC transporter ATP-binding protein [Dehalococcoidia bacterium]|nr:ABC transporter ATP-binding protein [Dehalococcoidia bacterium]
MLSVNGLYAGYGNGDVIKDITFSLMEGESLSIIGPNGCGKTTLLRAIANILAHQGTIEIDGKSIAMMKHKDIALRIAMLGQISAVYFTYTVWDTVMMGRYLHTKDRIFGLPSKTDTECVMHCLETVGLMDEKERGIIELSGGQLQRVFLARTLAQEPQIILLDEPTNHLDLKYQIELVEYLRRWVAGGKRAVIGVLHDINLALRLGDNLMVMKDGCVQVYGKTTDIINAELLKNTYDVDVVQYMRESLRIWENIKH